MDAIELDVTLSADGAVVVTHDLALNPDLTRGPDGHWLTAPTAAFCTLSAVELRRFDVGRARPDSDTALAYPFQKPADGQHIPLLSEVFALVAGTDVAVDVELKTDPADPRSADPAAVAEAVLAEVARLGMMDRLALRSFDWRGLRHARRLLPTLPMAFLTEAADAVAFAAVRVEAESGICAWAPGFRGLSCELVAAAHSQGLSVKPWTVNDPADMLRLHSWNADGFCTDRPDLARRVIA